LKMKKCVGIKSVIAAICVFQLLLVAGYANAGMVVFLKDGRVIQVPVNRDDIIGISFEENSSEHSPGKSTGVDTCTHRFTLCQAGVSTSYERCKARAGSNQSLLAQCEQDSRVGQQACKNRFDQCIRD